ncbi:MAG TPA: glycosyltransferase family 4 protein [Candidatus Saccharimonadales bacterium]|nr:glycosyltransferase family 4 protein [Candidatus Saccharimonadales bacterium]
MPVCRMRITLVNQTFYPDVVSSGQHLTDLALGLAERGHQVTVVTSRRAYDDPERIFPKREGWNGIRIVRVSATRFGKRARWRRAADFVTFLCSGCWQLFRLPKPDAVVAMTSPPLVSFLGAWLARLRGCQFCYWIMDLNPDEALAAKWLRAGSLAARGLERCSRFSLRHATRVVVLDHFMRQRILDKGIDAEKIVVVPPWSHDTEVRFDAEGRSRFRKRHGLEKKLVVMYAGNHSPCHPLDTVLGAAKELASNSEIVFLFVGGGSKFAEVKRFAAEHSLSNVLCLPYQPLDQLAETLSAADLHLIVMGDPFVGIVHPCKIYNILRVGSPVLYIGPQPSHISEILQALDGELPVAHAKHGEVDRVIDCVLAAQQKRVQSNNERVVPLAEKFSKDTLLPQLVAALETAANP